MALTIEGASIGFDESNVQTALNNINAKMITEASNKMDTSMSGLRDYVDSAWVGQSAETFKNNMEADKKVIQQALKDTYEALKTEIYQIMQEMADVDNALITKRGE